MVNTSSVLSNSNKAGKGLVIVPDFNDFYIIPKEFVLSETTSEYRKFLKDAGYIDLDSGHGLLVSKKLVRLNRDIRKIAKNNHVAVSGVNGDRLVRITQADARSIVEDSGYKVLTTGLMYPVFISYLKFLESHDSDEAKTTLDEMRNDCAEFLEDLVLEGSIVRIGKKEKVISLPDQVCSFDRSKYNFGYPAVVSQDREFKYWPPSSDKNTAVRYGGSELGLVLNWVPGCASGDLGVRFAKIFL